MTNKTFKPVIETDRRFKVVQSIDARAAFQLAIMDDFNGNKYVSFDNSDAPALALAILEAAGYDDMADDANLADVHAFNAMHKLQESVDTQERATAEAKEQAELEAEALELFNTLQTEIHGNLGPNWVPVTEFPSFETKRKWLAVARKAREMRAEK